MIHAATNDSSKLSGTAMYRRPKGKTPKFPMTNHIIPNPANHEIRAVWSRENFLDRMKITMAKKNDHTPHTAPFTGSDGKTIPRFSKWDIQYDLTINSFLDKFRSTNPDGSQDHRQNGSLKNGHTSLLKFLHAVRYSIRRILKEINAFYFKAPA